MESEFEKKLHQVRPRGITEDEKAMLWSNIEHSVEAEGFIKAHKKIAGPFNIFLNIKKIRYVVAAIVTGTLITGSFATVALADNSRPGDFLFPVELASETLRLRLTSPENRDELSVQFASERLEEVKELLALANINFEELPLTTTEDATSTATSTDDTSDGDTATSTDDTSDDDTSDDDTSDDDTDDDDTDDDDTDNDSSNEEDSNESQTTYDGNALVQASNAFLIALGYLQDSREALIADGNDTAVIAIDSFIAELTFLADNHVEDIEKARFVIDNNGNENQKVSIAIEASIDEVKTRFNFTEVVSGNGDSKQKIVFDDGESELKLKADKNKTVFEIDNEKDKKDNSNKNKSSKIDICYKDKDLELRYSDITKYLKKGASLGECHDDDSDDEDDDDDDDRKVYLCHKGDNTIHVSRYAKWAHLRHGDETGKCDEDKSDDNEVVVIPGCSLAGDVDGRTIFSFGGQMIRSDSGESSSYTSHKDVTLEEGLYKVTLMSYDGYVGREDDSQPDESWHIVLWDESENEFQQTSSVSDIPDNIRQETVIEVVDEGFEYNGHADELYAQHSAYPDTNSPNSVKVICAAFDQIEDTGDSEPPVITNIQSDEDKTSADVSWATDEDATSRVWYSETSGFDTGGITDFVSSGTLKKTHLLTINGLTASTTYYFKVESSDVFGNKKVSDEDQFTTSEEPESVDETAPIITGIAINPTTTEATAAWITNEPTTGVIWYSETSPVDIEGITDGKISSTLKTSHSVDILSLTSETIYHYIIVAADESGNTSTSTEDSFTTTSLPDPVDETAPIVSSIVATPTTTEATVAFTTDEDATSVLWYGLTSGSLDLNETNATLESLHTYTLGSLSENTMYYFEIVATDDSGNTATTTEDSFTTTEASEPADETAPVISSLSVESASTTTDVSFETDEDATSKIYYSPTSPVDLDLADSMENNGLSTSHDFNLVGLTASTTYYYVVTATDESLNEQIENESSFETL